VEWLRFDGIKEDGLVKLEWATASELNCSHFEVKESFDGRTFNTIGIVEGNGTVNSISEYRFNHRSPSNRKAYYTLKQIDYDGTFDYSKVVAIKAQTSVLVSPNPFRDEITCTKRIFLLAVAAPYRPATNTQARKNMVILLAQAASSIKKFHISPAARKPLYKPWLAAIDLVGVKSSSGNAPLKVLRPSVSQANISMYIM